MLKEETPMRLMLKTFEVIIDIDNKKLEFRNRKFNIDVSNSIYSFSDEIALIYSRIYKDFAITGFLYLKYIERYRAGGEKCPKFLKNLAELLNIEIDKSWVKKIQKYKLHLKLPLEFISDETFELSTEVSEIELKKWMLRKAVEKSIKNIGQNELFVYMKNYAIVLPEYISKYEKI